MATPTERKSKGRYPKLLKAIYRKLGLPKGENLLKDVQLIRSNLAAIARIKDEVKENEMAISENDNEIAKNAEDIEYIFPFSTVEPLSKEYPDDSGEYYSQDKQD